MSLDRRISIAPMMAITDRHFRVLARLLSQHVLLYTEMLTSAALIHGDRQRLLAYSAAEKPLALQLGGSDPKQLAICTRMVSDAGFDEVNLNVGCPSNRVQAGSFGACLMKQPELVAEAVALMSAQVNIPVTVKTRIGVDEVDSYEHLHHFVSLVAQAGCRVFIIHARKAWLQGLSPKENREIPPLRYDVVYQLKRDFPQLQIIINGGIKDCDSIAAQLEQLDGVMIGRAACSNLYLLAQVEQRFFSKHYDLPNRAAVIENYLPYLQQQLTQKVCLRSLIKHLFGLFQGQPGARHWRRYLTEHANASSGVEVVEQALRVQQSA